jgi:MFS family permease
MFSALLIVIAIYVVILLINNRLSVLRIVRSCERPEAVATIALLPFLAGYFLSYLFRTVNAVLADRLTADLHLNAAALGMLTSAYFLTATLAQLPIGVAIDRLGPVRVQAVLLLIAGAGAWLFATSEQFWTLIVGRSLIGLGVAGCLVAGLKTIVLSFERHRVPTFNGILVSMGALGALVSSLPLQWLANVMTWRQIFAGLATATWLVAVVFIFLDWRNEPRFATKSTKKANEPGIALILLDAKFWRLAPLSALIVGSAWALQGLWVGPWLKQVANYTDTQVALMLFGMAGVFGVSALSFGSIITRLEKKGIDARFIYTTLTSSVVLAELCMASFVELPAIFLWSVIAASGAATVLTYSLTPKMFPVESVARTNGVMNTLHFGAAFILQNVFGQILSLWPRNVNGAYPAEAYGAAFAVIALGQAAALVWFWQPSLRRFSDLRQFGLPLRGWLSQRRPAER